jgi:cytochrome c553
MRTPAFFSLVCLGALLMTACQPAATDTAADESTPEVSAKDKIERGGYLVNAMGCDECHTPKVMGEMGPEPDLTRRFMGHPSDLQLPEYEEAWVAPGQWILTNNDLTAWVGPWGTSYAANISSDDTGIGAWSEENFIRAIRQGLFKGIEGTRTLLPPMPWPMYKNLSDEDLTAIFAFLQASKPMSNVVPLPKINMPPEG